MQLRKVNQLSPSELNQIINLHLSILKESTLTRFGPKFLKIVYQTALKRNQDAFLVLKEDGKIRGYCVASLNIKDFYKQCLKENLPVVFWEVSKSCLKHPGLTAKILSWTFSNTDDNFPAELQFIVVDSQLQNQSWGSKMIKEINSFFKGVNISRYKVGTWASNEGSNNFYKKNGFKYLISQKILGTNFNFYLSPKLK